MYCACVHTYLTHQLGTYLSASLHPGSGRLSAPANSGSCWDFWQGCIWRSGPWTFPALQSCGKALLCDSISCKHHLVHGNTVKASWDACGLRQAMHARHWPRQCARRRGKPVGLACRLRAVGPPIGFRGVPLHDMSKNRTAFYWALFFQPLVTEVSQ